MGIRRRIKSWVHSKSPIVRLVLFGASLVVWTVVLAPVATMATSMTGMAFFAVGLLTLVAWIVVLYIMWSVVTSVWSRTRIDPDESTAS